MRKRDKRGCWLIGAVFLLTAEMGVADAKPPVLDDCRHCPRMVVVPGGTFTMGSPADEPDRHDFEGPRTGVDVGTFAMGRTEVTRRQYAAFVKATRRPPPAHGCFKFGFNAADATGSDEPTIDPSASWRNPGFDQTDAHPVTCISWQDAHDYATWLARKTGQHYRLPTEAEWEYAVRAGSSTRFFWGADEDAACLHANVADPALLRTNPIIRELAETGARNGNRSLRIVHCEDGAAYTVPVATYPPNPFGLYDMIGNAWEYVADCWQQSLPADGTAFEPQTCETRRVRGGSWDDTPPELRSARRSRVPPDAARNDSGFRVARDLSPAELARLRRP